MSDLPTGTVTFLFTDIEGSTRLLQQLGPDFGSVLDRHHAIVRRALEAEEGVEVRTEGDSFFAVFRTAGRAVRAAVTAQRDLAAQSWPRGISVRLRMGLHTGEGSLGGGDYLGIEVHLAARIAAAGHGGQILISEPTRGLIEHTLPDDVALRSLGEHTLKDFDHPQPLHDLMIEGLASEFPSIRSLAGPRRTNLPAPRTSFVGREREVQEVAELLAGTRLLTLTGPGGTGKTRLALRVAADRLEDNQVAVHFVDLAPVAEPSLVPSTIAGAVGVREETGADVIETVAGHLGDGPRLLVLDNFEQVVDAAPAVDRLLAAAPRLRVLVTSRIPLHLTGEREYLVGPLPLPLPNGRPDLAELGRFASVSLFVERARAVRADFRLTEDNAPAVTEIARRLDGLPLAIELAAVRVKLLGPQDILERLDRRLPLLTGGARDVPERHRALRETIGWSHELLRPDERRLFARLAAFRGGWTLAAAEAVCGPGLGIDVLDGQASLVDGSLVRRNQEDGGQARFAMLETIHEFARERLEESGELDEIGRRHAEDVRDLAEEAEPHLMGERQAEWIRRLELEQDNLRAALDRCESAGDAATALRTGAALWRFWQHTSRLAEGRDRLERAFALPEAAARDAVRVRALGALGGIRYWQMDYEGVREAYEEAAGIARDLGDPRLLSRALYDLSFVPVVLQDDFEMQERLLDEALALAGQDDRAFVARIWTARGYIRARRDGPAAGMAPIEHALAIHRELGDSAFAAESLVSLAGMELAEGDIAAARRHLRDGIRMVPDPVASFGSMAVAAAILATYSDDPASAGRLLGAWERSFEEGGAAPPPVVLPFLGDPETRTRAALGPEALERARAEGHAMTPKQATAYALEVVERMGG